MKDIAFASARELATAIANKRISPLEVVDAIADRIDQLNPKVNAYCRLRIEEACLEAKAAEQQVMRGEQLGLLHGVPVSVKDMTDLAGLPNTFGSKALAGRVSSGDAPVVERLRRAGAIILGKTNAAEFGHKAVTENLLFGITRNPWNLDRISGGSSGGAAAAVAAGLGPIAEGNDGAGSIRIPASCCGVYGLKPSFGLIAQTILPNKFFTIASSGPITRTVEDAALMLQACAGPDDRDPFSLPASTENYCDAIERGVRGARIAYSPDLGFATVEPEIASIVAKAVETFSELGARVEEVRLDLGDPEEIEWVLWRALYCTLPDLIDLDQWRDQMAPELLEVAKEGGKLSAREYLNAETARGALYDKLRTVFGTYEFLISPTMCCEPFEVGRLGPSVIAGRPVHPILGWLMTYPFNLTGQPACSIPCGFSANGLPIGMQIAGRRHQDGALLRISAAFEKARPWADRQPAL